MLHTAPVRAALLLAVVLLSGCMTARMRRELAAEYFNLGNSFFEIKNYDKALAMYEKALSYNEDFPENSYNLARLHISRSRYADAVRILNELLASDADNIVLLQTLAYAQAKAGDPAAAGELYRRILRLSEGNVLALYNLSVLAQEEGSTDEARELLKTAFSLAPSDPDVLRRLGILESGAGNTREAASYLQSYMEVKTDDAETALLLSELYRKQELYADAIKLIEAVLPRAEGKPDILFERAYLLLTKAQEEEKGMEALTKALEAGFADKEKLRVLLLETPSAQLRATRKLLEEKKALSAEEAEKILAESLSEKKR